MMLMYGANGLNSFVCREISVYSFYIVRYAYRVKCLDISLI